MKASSNLPSLSFSFPRQQLFFALPPAWACCLAQGRNDIQEPLFSLPLLPLAQWVTVEDHCIPYGDAVSPFKLGVLPHLKSLLCSCANQTAHLTVARATCLCYCFYECALKAW